MAEENPEIKNLLMKIPVVTHNQRNHVTIQVEYADKLNLEIEEVIMFVESRMNGSLLPLLKRLDEGEMVLNAHIHPKFVEDIVRDISFNIVKRFPKIGNDVKLKVSSESEESIHPHNAYAQIDTTFGTIRKEFN